MSEHNHDVRIGEALRLARKQAGMTLGTLAEHVGVSSATMSRVETGKLRLSDERISRCSELLGVDLVELVRNDDGELRRAANGRVGEPEIFRAGESGSWRDYETLRLDPGLQSALESFLEYGYHGTSVRDLAKRAGLSVPGLYHHYPRKEDLLVAIMDLTMGDFHARCAAARADGSTSFERFELLVECFALFHTYRHELAFIGASEMRSLEPEHRRRIAGIRNECQRMVTVEVLALAEEGRLDAEFPEDAARAVVTMLVGIANWFRIAGPMAPEEIARRYVRHATALVRIRSEQPVP